MYPWLSYADELSQPHKCKNFLMASRMVTGVLGSRSIEKESEMLALAAEHDFFFNDILLENVDRTVVSFTQIRTCVLEKLVGFFKDFMCTPSSIPF